jgi:sugar/nucleoside kinase (ribokinase family)
VTLLGIGHALVDALAFASDDVPIRLGLHTGSFNTVPDYRMRAILLTLGHRTLMAGGSSANVVKLASKLGMTAFFSSQCGIDDEGSLFESELQRAGVRTNLKRTDTPTGICVTFLTPAANRTIATFRSASAGLDTSLVSEAQLAEADTLVLEGYLLDEPLLLESLLERCRAAGKAVAFDTSDVALVERHRERLAGLIRAGLIAHLFAHEEEACSLVQGSADEALQTFSACCRTFVVKQGALGCRFLSAGKLVNVAATENSPVDTTGAGDAFQAGFLWGIDRRLGTQQACVCGNLVASVVLRHPGTRVDDETMLALSARLTEQFPR